MAGKKIDLDNPRLRAALPLIGFLFMIVLFTILTKGAIITPNNLQLQLSQMYMLMIAAIGVFFIITMGCLDFSQGSLMGVACIACCYFSNKNLFLLVVNIVFLLLGCVLDVSTIQLVFVPMVLPIVKAFGIDLVHFGVVICLNMMIGLSTPPFGMLLFIVSGLGKTKIGGVIREIIPMVLIMIALLFLCTYVPDIIMFIPNHMAG